MRKIAFVTDSKQGMGLSGLSIDEVFSFDPAVGYELTQSGYSVCPADKYDSVAHEQTVKGVAQVLEEITACGAKAYQLGEWEVSGFRANLYYILNWSYFVYYSTQHYKNVEAEFYYYSGGKLKKADSYDMAFAGLLDATARRYNHTYENINYSWVHYQLARFCNRLNMLVSGASRKLRVLHFGDSALKVIEEALWNETSHMVVFKPRSIGKTMAQTVFVTMCNVAKAVRDPRAHIHYFRAVRPALYRQTYVKETKNFGEALGALPLAFPHPAFMERIVEDSGWYMPFFRAQMKAGKRLAEDLGPHLTMTNKGKYHFIRSAIYFSAKRGMKSILINHGTHTAQASGTSKLAANLWASDDRICLKGVSYVVPKLPLTKVQVEEIYQQDTPEFVILPSVKRIAHAPGNPRESFKIVYAGNYFGPLYHIPWCAETPDEFLLSILELIEMLGGMPHVEFIIKLKARKASTHVTILQERIDALGVGHKIRIDTETKFLDLLRTTHLLISNLSTTIEEALTNRVPVLLYSYRKQYFHFPCAFDYGQGGYVYGVHKAEEVAPMIEGIRMDYQRIVENDTVLDGLIWNDGQFNNLQQFAVGIRKLTQ